MRESIRITIESVDSWISQEWDQAGPLVLGRQNTETEPLGQVRNEDGAARMAIVPWRKVDVSRRQIHVERHESGRVLLKNLSPAHPVRVGDRLLQEEATGPGWVLPVTLQLADCKVRMESGTQTLSEATHFHEKLSPEEHFTLPRGDELSEYEHSGEIVSFLNRVISVLQLSASRAELFDQACKAVKALLPVDGVAMFTADGWERVAGDDTLSPHQRALDRLLEEHCVLWKETGAALAGETAPTLECYVAAPVITKGVDGEVVYGALYAHRARGGRQDRPRLTELHARLMEVVACSVAAGIFRIKQEEQTRRFEGFFTPSVATELATNPELLEATEKQITVLFCDIRGFSKVCEDLDAETTSEWICDVLSELSQCVLDYDGVLVDYIGDELLGMWGAPREQENHAHLACQAALAMTRAMGRINQKYTDRVKCETCVGIGINSGLATVGNTGSRQKFKYGPLGDTVNRGSRVQGLTKYLKVPVLITEETHALVRETFPARRIGKAKAVNMDRPIELFELITVAERELDAERAFEAAIEHLERGQLREAAERLAPELDFGCPDQPALLAFRETLDRIIHDRSAGEYQWDFGAK